MAIALSFVRGTRYHRTYVPLDQAATRAPAAIVEGLVVAIVVYWASGRRKSNVYPNVVCPKCGKFKSADGSITCECGGEFVNADEMKWRDD
jgi:hypothetical protein